MRKGNTQTIVCLLNNPKVNVNCGDGMSTSPYLTLLLDSPIARDDKKYIIETVLENPRVTEETLNFDEVHTPFRNYCCVS